MKKLLGTANDYSQTVCVFNANKRIIYTSDKKKYVVCNDVTEA